MSNIIILYKYKNVRIPKVNLGTFYKHLKILSLVIIEMIKYENIEYNVGTFYLNLRDLYAIIISISKNVRILKGNS